MNWQAIQEARGKILVICSKLDIEEFKELHNQLGMDIYHVERTHEKRAQAKEA